MRPAADATTTADTTGAPTPSDCWPNVLFDTREALQRDTAPAGSNVILGGVMYYITLDVANLSQWFRGTAPFNGGTGANANIDNTGFTVYFSDRRNNRNTADLETGEYGFEDFVNPAVATGAPNTRARGGEDVNDEQGPRHLRQRFRTTTACPARCRPAPRRRSIGTGVADDEPHARSGEGQPRDPLPARAEARQRRRHRAASASPG